ncbi:hypothetical protein SLEP1_g29180 [Rubroshorea leprosula]|uniref:Uncharacterized protein n=1 Tax=Rubroshorea leprosula TaxID=152421 RepID=A0AAV5K585_9ROSI|nr:hypothetical protein SLEP1_g29180 [Rubroshorea leprosula]
MEWENKKRRREEEDNLDKSAKKQDINHYDHNSTSDVIEESDGYLSPENNLALGVFDFPWLHEDEGMIWKLEECNFEDTFSSSLENNTTWFEFSGQSCMLETCITFPEYKFEENVLWPLKGDVGLEMDCIWGCLQQGQQGASKSNE